MRGPREHDGSRSAEVVLLRPHTEPKHEVETVRLKLRCLGPPAPILPTCSTAPAPASHLGLNAARWWERPAAWHTFLSDVVRGSSCCGPPNGGCIQLLPGGPCIVGAAGLCSPSPSGRLRPDFEHRKVSLSGRLATTLFEPLSGHQTRSVGGYRDHAVIHTWRVVATWLKYGA